MYRRMLVNPAVRSCTRRLFSSKSSDPLLKTFLLEYEFVDGMLERIPATRPQHLDYMEPFVEKGNVLAIGTLVPKVDRGIVIIRASSLEDAEDIARSDPYVKDGLVMNWKVTEWMVIAGNKLFGLQNF